jgi:N-acetylneuraminic acid mutarotase
VSQSEFSGSGRIGAVSFVLNNLGYVATGFDGTNYLNDMWCFDPSIQSWVALDTLPGPGRSLGVAFATSKYGYVGTGWNGSEEDFFNDFYKFDPVANSWSTIPSIKTSSNGGFDQAMAFGIGAPYNIGGVVGGTIGSSTYKDFYVWKEDSGAWVTEPFPGPKWYGAVTWVYQNKAYVVTGSGSNGLAVSDFYFYDPSKPLGTRWSDSLRRIFGVTDQSYDAGYHVQRTNAVAFLGESNGIPKAYVTLGSNNSSVADCWEYDFAKDVWSMKQAFPGAARVGAIAMTLNTTDPSTHTTEPHGFIGLGSQSLSAAQPGSIYYSDITEFYPDLPYNSSDYHN